MLLNSSFFKFKNQMSNKIMQLFSKIDRKIKAFGKEIGQCYRFDLNTYEKKFHLFGIIIWQYHIYPDKTYYRFKRIKNQ